MRITDLSICNIAISKHYTKHHLEFTQKGLIRRMAQKETV